ncbi:MAG: metallophosphoesterase [Armatimonadetes bacterium]|nr:metallophosphoesterase [Armatimonadota bacterium]
MIEVAAAAGAAVLVYSAMIERTAVSLTKLDLEFERLPQAFDGLKILQLSDFHISHWWTLERRVEMIVQSIEPDIVALTGDITVNRRGARLLKEFLQRTFPDSRIFAVYGNTEHKGRYGELRRADLDFEPLRMLTNEHIAIERGGQSIIVAGVDDPYTLRDDIRRALDGAPIGTFKLLLAHSPDVAGEAAKAGVDIVLSGHTHGGQARFPILGALYPHLRRHKQMVQGLFEGERLSRILKSDAGDMRVYVSRGIGISNLPIRFLCPPEVVLITLHCRA